MAFAVLLALNWLAGVLGQWNFEKLHETTKQLFKKNTCQHFQGSADDFILSCSTNTYEMNQNLSCSVSVSFACPNTDFVMDFGDGTETKNIKSTFYCHCINSLSFSHSSIFWLFLKVIKWAASIFLDLIFRLSSTRWRQALAFIFYSIQSFNKQPTSLPFSFILWRLEPWLLK